MAKYYLIYELDGVPRVTTARYTKKQANQYKNILEEDGAKKVQVKKSGT